MTLSIRSILRQATRKQGEKLNILTFPTHERYQGNLANCNAEFYLWHGNGIKKWDQRFGPLPANHHLLPHFDGNQNSIDILQTLPMYVDFDLILSQSKAGQYQVAANLAKLLHVGLVNIEHTLPTAQWKANPSVLNKIKQMKGDINLFISEYSMGEWGWTKDEAEVIYHGIDTEIFKPLNLPRKQHVLSVVNDWVNRDWCKLAGQKILTINGYVNIENIQVGNKVLSDNGIFNIVTETFKRDYYGDIIDIYLDNNKEKISFTPNHHIRVKRNNQETYVEANRLKVGDLLKFPQIKQTIFYPEDKNYAWLIGSIIGDGSITNTGTVSISYKLEDINIANRATDLLSKYSGNKAKLSHKNIKKGIYVVEVTSKIFGKWLKSKIGDYSKNKRIPDELYLGSDQTKLSVLQGLWSADGSFKNGKSVSPRFVYSTSSIVLASQVSAILHDFGIKCNIRKEKRTTNKSNGKLLNIYRVVGTGIENVENCIKLINNGNILYPYSYTITKVDLIENVNTTVYNCAVSSDPSYVVYPGFVAHNCCGFRLWQASTQGLPVRTVGDTPGLSLPASSLEDLVNEYNSSQVFINTSLISPIPTSLLEAAACGCAIISTNNCAIPELIKHGENGFLANDPAEINYYAKELLLHPDLCIEFGMKARQSVLQKFNKETFVKKWDQIFNRASNIVYKG